MKEEIQNRLLAYREKLVKTRVVNFISLLIWGLLPLIKPGVYEVIYSVRTYVSSVSITIVGNSSASSSNFDAIVERAVAKDTSPLSISPFANIK